jgi:hypothetical protein
VDIIISVKIKEEEIGYGHAGTIVAGKEIVIKEDGGIGGDVITIVHRLLHPVHHPPHLLANVFTSMIILRVAVVGIIRRLLCSAQ